MYEPFPLSWSEENILLINSDIKNKTPTPFKEVGVQKHRNNL
jgi:hypothetical protein